MRALVVYESMYGNTRAIAEAIADGLAISAVATAARVGTVEPDQLRGLDLLVLGAPTHTWSLSRPKTRDAAAQAAARPASGLTLEPGATGPGLREWLQDEWLNGTGKSRVAHTRVVCFDTRMHAPLGLSGSAGRALARRLRRAGRPVHTAVEGFVVTKQNQLVDGELARARAWGEHLAESMLAATM
jgi:flavodoxin-like protein